MKVRKKFFTMFLSMLLVFTMMPLSAIPVTAASSTDPPPAALDQTNLADETLTETDIQTETESTTTPEPPPASETPDGSQSIRARQPNSSAALRGLKLSHAGTGRGMKNEFCLQKQKTLHTDV